MVTSSYVQRTLICLQARGKSQFLVKGVCGVLFFFSFFWLKEFLYANSVDPDQMPHYPAYDLGLHCLPMSISGHPRH